MKWWSNKIKNTFSLTGFSESRLRRLPENQARERVCLELVPLNLEPGAIQKMEGS
jgi:hypothetical protein